MKILWRISIIFLFILFIPWIIFSSFKWIFTDKFTYITIKNKKFENFIDKWSSKIKTK